MTTTVPAGKATPGRYYRTPRGTLIKVIGTVQGSTDVKVENEHGRHLTLTEAYPLGPVASVTGPALEDLVGVPLASLLVEVARLTMDQLDELEDLDPRPEVLEATTARRAELQGTAPTATCHACGSTVATMDGRGGGELLAVHQDQGGAYCAGSGTSPTLSLPSLTGNDGLTRPAPAEPAPEPPTELQEPASPEPEPEALEDELQAEPEDADPWRHLAGATTAAERIKAVRRIMVIHHLVELEDVRAELQAKVARELDRQGTALEAMEAAINMAMDEGDQADMKRLVARQDYQGRPGVMALARAAFAQLQGRGDQVDHGIEPVAPSELEDPAPETDPALVTWLQEYTGRVPFPPETVQVILDLTSTVRDSRTALQAVESRATVRLAYLWEAMRPVARPTILDQVGARLVALGGELPDVPTPSQAQLVRPTSEAKVEAQRLMLDSRAAGDARPTAYMEGRQGEHGCRWKPGTVDAELWAMGAADLAELVDQGVVKRAGPPSENFAKPETVAVESVQDEPEPKVDPWNLSELPMPEQVARSTTARALELIKPMIDPEQVKATRNAEVDRGDGGRPEVLAVLESLDRVLDPPPLATAKDLQPAGPVVREPKAERPVAPAGTVNPEDPPHQWQGGTKAPQVLQIKDMEIVELPDGRRELWGRPPGARPFRVGDCADPRLAPHLAALEASKAPQAFPPPPVQPEVVQVAQAGLAALAAALPALAAMGLDVTFKITTRAG